jgi:hypothetical protein
MGDRRDKLEAGIQFLDSCQLLQERSFLKKSYGIKQENSMPAFSFCCMPNHASEGRDANATREKDRRPGDVPMERQIAIRALQNKRSANRQCAGSSLESCVPHSHCNQEVLFVRRAGDGERSSTAARIGRSQEINCEIRELAWLELESVGLFKVQASRSCAQAVSGFQDGFKI